MDNHIGLFHAVNRAPDGSTVRRILAEARRYAKFLAEHPNSEGGEALQLAIRRARPTDTAAVIITVAKKFYGYLDGDNEIVVDLGEE